MKPLIIGRLADLVWGSSYIVFKYRELIAKQKKDVLVSAIHGDLLKTEGDILLCPVSRKFLPSNPLSRQVIIKEGMNLAHWLDFAISETQLPYRNNSAIFLPCRKLKYRGVIFVEMDFHSDSRQMFNLESMKLAFDLAEKYGCKKLKMPHDMLYSKADTIVDNFFQLASLFNESEKIPSFALEIVLKSRRIKHEFRRYYHEYGATEVRLNYSSKLYSYNNKYLPKYRYPVEYYYGYFLKRKLLAIFTKHNIKSDTVSKCLRTLKERLGSEYDTGVDVGNRGFEKELGTILKELPWNEDQIKEILRSLENC